MKKSTYYLNMGKGTPVKVEGYIFNVEEFNFGVDKRDDDPKYSETPWVVTEISTGFSMGKNYSGTTPEEAAEKVTKGIKAIREKLNEAKTKTKWIDLIKEFKQKQSELNSTKTSRRRLI